MRFLVTGGSGFIGSHLIKRLKEIGEVINIDKKIGKDIRHDLNEKADYIFHLAALHLPKDMVDLREAYSTNVEGTRNVLEHAKRVKAKVISSSSAAVYGDEGEPINHYGITKHMAEELCNFYNVGTTILRYFNVYGEGGSGLINILEKCKQENIQPKIFGDGESRRDYIHVSDVIDANLLAMKQTGIFDVGTGKNYSANELCEMLDLKPIYVNSIEEIKDSVSKGIRLRSWAPKGLWESLKR